MRRSKKLCFRMIADTLLRMSAGEFSLPGGTMTMKFEGRLLASTNRDLGEAMAADGLRKDLRYRFSAQVISAPPLRERLDDVPLLAGCFLRRAVEGRKLPPRDLQDRDMVRLCAYHWPGNVRELENAIASFAISGRLLVPPLPHGPSHDPHPPAGLELLDLCYPEAKEIAVRRFQKEYVPVILAAHGGDVAAAAAQMGISRVGLQKILQQMAESVSPRESEDPSEK
jgi:DNA-binding NtrC family response regulator